ncbi:MAG: hypothetical protein AAGA68_16625 [Pseudomonadota bacterium]
MRAFATISALALAAASATAGPVEDMEVKLLAWEALAINFPVVDDVQRLVDDAQRDLAGDDLLKAMVHIDDARGNLIDDFIDGDLSTGDYELLLRDLVDAIRIGAADLIGMPAPSPVAQPFAFDGRTGLCSRTMDDGSTVSWPCTSVPAGGPPLPANCDVEQAVCTLGGVVIGTYTSTDTDEIVATVTIQGITVDLLVAEPSGVIEYTALDIDNACGTLGVTPQPVWPLRSVGTRPGNPGVALAMNAATGQLEWLLLSTPYTGPAWTSDARIEGSPWEDSGPTVPGTCRFAGGGDEPDPQDPISQGAFFITSDNFLGVPTFDAVRLGPSGP